jgi:GNAT superfamily N-acetyltransferase
MEIRAAITGELARLREVRDRSAHAGCCDVYSHEQLTAWLNRPLPEKMRGLLNDGFVLVAVERQEIVGYAALDPANNEVEAVFVLPSMTGQGVGRALLGALEALALDLSLTNLRLSASLNAVPFYRRAGYVSSAPGLLPLSELLSLEYESMEKGLGGSD